MLNQVISLAMLFLHDTKVSYYGIKEKKGINTIYHHTKEKRGKKIKL